MSIRLFGVFAGAACATILALSGCATTAPAASGEMEAAAGDVHVTSPAVTTLDMAQTTAPAASGEHESGCCAPCCVPPLPQKLNTVTFLDEKLYCRVVVTKTTYRRTPSNTFEVLASFQNMTDKPVRLKVRTQYFDADRVSQEGPGAWQMVFLPPNGIETYKTHSYRTDLEYYYIEVNEHCD